MAARIILYLSIVAICALSSCTANAAAGSLDPAFTPLSLSAAVHSVQQESSGRYLIGGVFQNAGGDPDTDYVARLSGNGSRDATFEPPSLNSTVYSVTILSNGKYMIGGNFTDAGNISAIDRVARLNSNGSLDLSFSPPSLNNTVYSTLEIQGTGFLIGGAFINVGGDGDLDRVIRVDSGGSLDSLFEPTPLFSYVRTIKDLSNGQFLLGGNFPNAGNDPDTDYVAKLNSTGSRDANFRPLSLNGPVYSIAALSDGKYLIGGNFTAAGGDTNTNYLARLHADGSRDTDFTPLTLNNPVWALAELSDGSYLIGGMFTSAGGDPNTRYLARLNENGSRDTTFSPPTLNGIVYSLKELRDGNYLIGGAFTNAGGDLNVDYVAKILSGYPTPPELVSNFAGNSSASINWTPPVNDGGSAITDYEYRLDGTGSWIPFGSTDTSATLSGLTNGTTYGVEVRAVNALGEGPPSNSLDVTPVAPTATPQAASEPPVPVPINTLVGMGLLSLLLSFLGAIRINDLRQRH